jgi:hypothetical protein
MTHVGIDIDLSGDACDFDKAKWIGRGHKYPINPPTSKASFLKAEYCICNQGDEREKDY